MPQAWKKKLENTVKTHLKGYPACHDFYHHFRTNNYAMKIAAEIPCDRDVVYAASLLHDIGYKGNEKDDKNHHKYGMKLAKKWLKEVEFPKEKIKEVLEAIRLHDNFAWDEFYEPTDHIETKIVQDADRIEALGAVGISRLAYYFGEKGYPIYNPEPVENSKKHWTHHSLLNQTKKDVENKWQNLNFPVSKQLSKKKHSISEKFYKELKRELEGAHGV